MPRLEPSAAFEKSGVWIFSRYLLTTRSLNARRSMNRAAYDALVRRQSARPSLVLEDSSRPRRLWMFRGQFYWEDSSCDETEVLALLLEREAQAERRVQRAVALMQKEPLPDVNRRRNIPTELRVHVWNRDGGHCAECGSDSELQFDHIIPVALGGATSAENLQLLCLECNRAKGASLA